MQTLELWPWWCSDRQVGKGSKVPALPGQLPEAVVAQICSWWFAVIRSCLLLLSFQERHQAWVNPSGHSSSYKTQTLGPICSLLYDPPFGGCISVTCTKYGCSWLNSTTKSPVIEPWKTLLSMDRDNSIISRDKFSGKWDTWGSADRPHSPLLSPEDRIHVIPSAVALSKCQRKSSWLYWLPISRRQDMEFVYLSPSNTNIKHHSLWKAGHSWRAAGKAGIQQTPVCSSNCTLNSVVGIWQRLQHLSLSICQSCQGRQT